MDGPKLPSSSKQATPRKTPTKNKDGQQADAKVTKRRTPRKTPVKKGGNSKTESDEDAKDNVKNEDKPGSAGGNETSDDDVVWTDYD